jgi:hypothetical protein
MPIYINRNGEQTGPFDDRVIIERLHSGHLSPGDLAIRTGDSQWQTLDSLFPDAVARPVATSLSAVSLTDPQYRNTVFARIFFGLCLLVEIVISAALAYYFYGVIDPSRKVTTLLDRTVIGILLIMLSGNLVGTFVTLLAFAMSFKRKIIRSNGLRLSIRIVSILILLTGFGNVAFWGYRLYETNHAYNLTNINRSDSVVIFGLYDMMVPYGVGLIIFPIAVGLVLFGLSGILMTQRARV